MKKFITIFATLMLCVILVTTFMACGDPNKGGNNKDGIINNAWWTTTGELYFDSEGKVDFQNVNLDLTSIVTGDDKEALESIISKFNTQYRNKIKVNLTMVNQDSYDATVSSQISQGINAPHLLMCHQKSLKAFADNELLQPFDEALEKSKIDIDLADYSQGLAQHASMGYKDYTFGIPADAQSCVVLVNKTLLKKYVADETIPTTRSGLIDLLNRVKTGEGTSYAIAWPTNGDFFSTYVFITSLLQNGLDLYDEETYLADWYSNQTNREAFKKGVEAIQYYINNGLASGYSAVESNNYASFNSNKSLFLVCMPWNLDNIIENYRQANGISADTDRSEYVGATSLAGWFAMDENSATKNALYGDSHFFAMGKQVASIEEKAAICEFIRWFTQETNIAIQWGNAGHISAYVPVATSSAYKADTTITNYIIKFYGDINNFHSIGVTPYHLELTGRLGELFAGIDDTNNIESLIQSAETKFNEDVEIGEM